MAGQGGGAFGTTRLSLSGSPRGTPTRRRGTGSGDGMGAGAGATRRGSHEEGVVEAVVRPRTGRSVSVKGVIAGTVNVARSIRTELVFGVWQMWFMLAVVVLFIWSFSWMYLASAWNPLVRMRVWSVCPCFGSEGGGCNWVTIAARRRRRHRRARRAKPLPPPARDRLRIIRPFRRYQKIK
jgi:hypothetical protein